MIISIQRRLYTLQFPLVWFMDDYEFYVYSDSCLFIKTVYITDHEFSTFSGVGHVHNLLQTRGPPGINEDSLSKFHDKQARFNAFVDLP